jgi:hypothetical protein
MIANMLVELVGLSVVIFAAVAYLKQWGISGNALTGSGFVIGLVIGLAYRYATSPMTDFASWFWAVMFGLMAGFLATGAYKGAQDITGVNKVQPVIAITKVVAKTDGVTNEQLLQAVKDAATWKPGL